MIINGLRHEKTYHVFPKGMPLAKNLVGLKPVSHNLFMAL